MPLPTQSKSSAGEGSIALVTVLGPILFLAPHPILIISIQGLNSLNMSNSGVDIC